MPCQARDAKMSRSLRLHTCLQVRIMLSVLQFRLNRRYVEADPPFVAIELDQSDSGREGCAVSTLTITSEPKDWRGAVQVPVPSTISPFLHPQPYSCPNFVLCALFHAACLKHRSQACDEAQARNTKQEGYVACSSAVDKALTEFGAGSGIRWRCRRRGGCSASG